MPLFDPKYEWFDDREPIPPWRRINWWSVAPIVLALAIVSFAVTMCSLTMF